MNSVTFKQVFQTYRLPTKKGKDVIESKSPSTKVSSSPRSALKISE